MRAIIAATLAVAALAAAAPCHADVEELGTYAVRWVHGGTTDYGQLVINTNEFIFKGDDGEVRHMPFIWLDEVRIVEAQWIQLRSNQETGISWGMNDVYNFGVVGGQPDPDVIDQVNQLIIDAKVNRMERAAKLPNERTRYMAAKAERVGDDIGMLIITENRLIFRSDSGGKNHEWLWSELKGIELIEPTLLKVQTEERSVLKLGGRRAYRFISQVGPYNSEDLAFMMVKIAENRPSEEGR